MRHLASTLIAAALLLSAPFAQAWRPPAPTVHTVTGDFLPWLQSAPGFGTVTATFDSVARTMAVAAVWDGLGSNSLSLQLHCCADRPNAENDVPSVFGAGSLPGFVGGATSGTYSHTFNLSDRAIFGAEFLAFVDSDWNGNTFSAVSNGFQGRRQFFNIATELRPTGQLYAFPIDEPPTLAILAAGLLIVAGRHWTGRSRAGKPAGCGSTGGR